MKHTRLGIYQIYSEACLPHEKVSEENGASYTDIDQLIRKRQNVVEKSATTPPPPSLQWDLSKFFRKFRGSIRLYLKQEAGIRTLRTNYYETMIFTLFFLAKAYVLCRIKTV